MKKNQKGSYSYIRKHIWKIIEPDKYGNKSSRIFDLILLGMIGLNVISVTIESLPSLSTNVENYLRSSEIVFLIFFSLEYVIRLWACVEEPDLNHPIIGRLKFMIRPFPLIDFLAILPAWLYLISPATVSAIAGSTLILRIIRFVRIFRILKVKRYNKAIENLENIFKEKSPELLITTSFSIVLIIMSSGLMYLAEYDVTHDDVNKNFSSIPASMWWAVVTLTTVGYGDMVPTSIFGKIIGFVIAFLGIGLFTVPTGIILSAMQEKIKVKDSTDLFPIIDLSSKSPKLLKEVQSSQLEIEKLFKDLKHTIQMSQLLEKDKKKIIIDIHLILDELIESKPDKDEILNRLEIIIHKINKSNKKVSTSMELKTQTRLILSQIFPWVVLTRNQEN